VATPILLDESEPWAQNRSDTRNIETAETRFLRYVGGYSIQDEISNLTICDELQIFDISDKIKDKRREYYDHIEQINPHRKSANSSV
jgi:hypothetical protein